MEEKFHILQIEDFQEDIHKTKTAPETLSFERDTIYKSTKKSFSRSISDRFMWTWKCWLPQVMSEICIAKAIKQFTIILFLVCAIIFVIIILFGEPIELMQLMRKPDRSSHLEQYQKDKLHNISKGQLRSSRTINGVIKSVESNKLDPVQHFDAVRMENNGRLNKEYRKELFIGDHEEFEEATDEEITKKLEDIFHKVDSDRDDLIDVYELEEWIRQKVQDHLDENTQENQQLFNFLDKNHDGQVSWKEYFREFLFSRGHNAVEAEKHSEDYESIHMDPSEKEILIRQKFRWSDADQEPQDNQLSIDEFRDFRHPEQSPAMLDRLVSDILSNLDRDRNGFLSEYEFIAHPDGEAPESESVSPGELARFDRKWREERRQEFRQIVDTDNDGTVTKEELMKYVDPSNPSHARNEARHLLSQADTNHDLHLSLEEMLNKKQLILGSKMIDPAKNFHDEF